MKTVILLAGASNAGKTTLARTLSANFNDVAHIWVDGFYHTDQQR